MEQAMWNGDVISAYEISLNDAIEEQVRKASRDGGLHCLDPYCKNSRLKYNHGEIRIPFFSHINNSNCIYDEFERNTPNLIKKYYSMIAQILRDKGYTVEVTKCIASNHFAHLLICHEDVFTAVEFITAETSETQKNNSKKLYDELGYQYQFIEVTNNTTGVKLGKRFLYAKHNCRDEWENEMSIKVKIKNDRIILVAEDHSDYFFRHRMCQTIDRVLSVDYDMQDIDLKNGYITCANFDQDFKRLKEMNQNRFENWKKELIAQTEEREKQRKIVEEAQKQQVEERKRVEEQKWKMNEQETGTDKETNKLVVTRNNIFRKNNQEKTEVVFPTKEELLSAQEKGKVYRDNYGNRIAICRHCGKIADTNEFISYGGTEGINTGICNCCKEFIGATVYETNKERLRKDICPLCGKKLVERNGRNGRFIGCTGYPDCIYTRNRR